MCWPPDINKFNPQLTQWSWLIVSKFTQFIAQPYGIPKVPSPRLYGRSPQTSPSPPSSLPGQPLGCPVCPACAPSPRVVWLRLELTVTCLTYTHRLQDAQTSDLRLKATAPAGGEHKCYNNHNKTSSSTDFVVLNHVHWFKFVAHELLK